MDIYRTNIQHIHMHAHIHEHGRTYTQLQTYIHLHTHMYVCIYARMHTYTHACMYTCTCTCTHTQTYTLLLGILSRKCPGLFTYRGTYQYTYVHTLSCKMLAREKLGKSIISGFQQGKCWQIYVLLAN